MRSLIWLFLISLNSKIPTTGNFSFTYSSAWSSSGKHISAYRYGNILMVCGYGSLSSDVAKDGLLLTLNDLNGASVNLANGTMIKYNSASAYSIYGNNGKIYADQYAIPSGSYSLQFVCVLR